MLFAGLQRISLHAARQSLLLLAPCHSYCTTPSRVGVGIVGAPMWKGQPQRGVERGPARLRGAGLPNILKAVGLDVKDYGDIKFNVPEEEITGDKIKNPLTIAMAAKQVSDKVSQVLLDNRLCLTLGGDHSLAVGTVHGHAQLNPDLCVLWIDAHSDINTALTTNSGNMHGLPVSFLVKEASKYTRAIPGFEWAKPCLEKNRIAYIGLRDVEPLERLLIDTLGIPSFSMRDVDRYGIFAVIKKALDAINPGCTRPVHVSFDIDSIDSAIAPSTGTAVPGGLTLREAICIGEEVSKTGMLQALDVVEVNPSLGDEIDVYRTVTAGIHVIKAFLGNDRGGNLITEYLKLPTIN